MAAETSRRIVSIVLAGDQVAKRRKRIAWSGTRAVRRRREKPRGQIETGTEFFVGGEGYFLDLQQNLRRLDDGVDAQLGVCAHGRRVL
jgi:hypothetical protein